MIVNADWSQGVRGQIHVCHGAHHRDEQQCAEPLHLGVSEGAQQQRNIGLKVRKGIRQGVWASGNTHMGSHRIPAEQAAQGTTPCLSHQPDMPQCTGGWYHAFLHQQYTHNRQSGRLLSESLDLTSQEAYQSSALGVHCPS